MVNITLRAIRTLRDLNPDTAVKARRGGEVFGEAGNLRIFVDCRRNDAMTRMAPNLGIAA
jgi:hypothetical protein